MADLNIINIITNSINGADTIVNNEGGDFKDINTVVQRN